MSGRWNDVVDLDPADEAAHVELMRQTAAARDRHAALRQFERLDRVLRRELGVAPGAEAHELRDRVLAAIPESPLALPLIGRQRELGAVDALLADVARGRAGTLSSPVHPASASPYCSRTPAVPPRRAVGGWVTFATRSIIAPHAGSRAARYPAKCTSGPAHNQSTRTRSAARRELRGEPPVGTFTATSERSERRSGAGSPPRETTRPTPTNPTRRNHLGHRTPARAVWPAVAASPWKPPRPVRGDASVGPMRLVDTVVLVNESAPRTTGRVRRRRPVGSAAGVRVVHPIVHPTHGSRWCQR